MLTRVEAGNMSSSSSKFTYVNVGSVSITAPVSTVVSPVSVFVTVKDVSADSDRSPHHHIDSLPLRAERTAE